MVKAEASICAELQPVAQRHHMVSGTLALLRYLVIYMNGKQGSGPYRGRSPVEWGEIPSVRPSIPPPPLDGARPQGPLARPREALARP